MSAGVAFKQQLMLVPKQPPGVGYFRAARHDAEK